MCDMTHSYVWHDSFICVAWRIHTLRGSFTCVTWLIHMCAMTHAHVWHDSFTCVTWLIHMCDMTHSYMWHDSFICVTWLIHMSGLTLEKFDVTFDVKFDVTYWYLRRDSLITVTWLTHTCDMTHSYVWHDRFIYVCDLLISATWLVDHCDMMHSCVWLGSFICWRWLPWLLHMHMCDKTFSYVCRDSCAHVGHDSIKYVTWLNRMSDLTHVTHMKESCHIHEGVMSHIWRSHVTHMNESCHAFICVTSYMCDMPPNQMSDLTHSNMRHHAFILKIFLTSIRVRWAVFWISFSAVLTLDFFARHVYW